VIGMVGDLPNHVTDVGSVKGTVLAALRHSGADLARYVGSHPMAGSQRVGPLTANADLFVDRTWVITPHDTSAAHAVLDVQELARLCGCRVTMGPRTTTAVAQVSHVPHLVRSMAGRLTELPPEHLRFADKRPMSPGSPVRSAAVRILLANAAAVLRMRNCSRSGPPTRTTRLGSPNC
jgi:prephenate dehydrogenase